MKTLFSLTLLLLTAILTGCVQNENNHGNAPKSNSRVLTVNYSFDAPKTRVSATSNEREVNDVAALFYKANADVSKEMYVACQTMSIPTGSSSMGSFAFPIPDEIEEGESYRLILIGNYNKYKPGGQDLDAYANDRTHLTYTQMKDEISGTLEDGKRATTPLPFYGRLSDGESEDITLVGPAATATKLGISVRFSRSVSRFDVVNLAAGKLKIKWAKVCNYRDEGHYFLENVERGVIVRGTSTENPDAQGQECVSPTAPVETEDDRWRQDLTTGGLYAFPNVVSYTSQNDRLTTFLMIAGQYKGASDTEYSDEVTYYRVNVSQNGSSQVLRRNYVYTVVVNDVKGPGANSEEGAANEKDKLIDYTIDDAWDDTNGGTVVDEKGNFLTISRSAVVLPGDKDASELIKVAVKTGTSWDVEWEDSPEEDFHCEKVDENSFMILTNNDNTTDFTRNAKLTVKVTETTLSQEISVIQLSNKKDPALLLIDGQMGNIAYTVPGQGATFSLPVVTGSSTCIWKATSSSAFEAYCRHTKDGGNNAFLQLEFRPNMTANTRTGTVTVRRYLTGGTAIDNTVPPIVITFTQEKSPYVMTIYPNYPDGLVIDAFDVTTAGVSNLTIPSDLVRWEMFQVLLADPENYYMSATSNFHKGSDAFLTVSNMDLTTRATALESSQSNSNQSSINLGTYSRTFWLNVFRMGPGDEDIKGTITVTATPTVAGLTAATISIPVTLTSSCKIRDVRLGNTLWADRNVGTPHRGIYEVGLSYSATGDDNKGEHELFRGSTHNVAQAATMCARFGEDNQYEEDLKTGWRLPTNAEIDKIVVAPYSYYISKQRMFILSEDKAEGGEPAGCWIPTQAGNVSYYRGGEGGYTLYIANVISQVSGINSTASTPLRCVRTVTP